MDCTRTDFITHNGCTWSSELTSLYPHIKAVGGCPGFIFLQTYYKENCKALGIPVEADRLNCYEKLINFFVIFSPANGTILSSALAASNIAGEGEQNKQTGSGSSGGLLPFGLANILGDIPAWLWVLILAFVGYNVFKD